MMRVLLYGVLGSLLWIAACAPRPDPQVRLNSLVEAERAFAQLSVMEGMRAAFLANLADDAILFRPTPVLGKTWFAEREAVPGILDWQPAFADLSGAGDLGFTTGPYTYSATDSTPPVSYGHYVTVWRKGIDGAWKVALDTGIDHTAPEDKPVVLTYPDVALRPIKPLRNVYAEAARIRLLRADKDMAAASETRGSLAAYQGAVADSVRLYRNGRFPTTGRQALPRILGSDEGILTWVPIAAEVAQSGDLGYTYGLTTRRTAPEDSTQASSSYLRIWRIQPDSSWAVVLDLDAPIPPGE